MSTKIYNLNQNNLEVIASFSSQYEQSCEFQIIGNFDNANIEIQRSILPINCDDYNTIKDALNINNLFTTITDKSIISNVADNLTFFYRGGNIKFQLNNATANTNIWVIISNVNSYEHN